MNATGRVVTKVLLLASAYLSVCGWLLSLLEVLNATGYCVALLTGLAAGIYSFRRWKRPKATPFAAGKLRWRLRHWLPAIFYGYAVLAFVGGLLHAPNNFDALAYRIPRVLHWLSESHWHWISTTGIRMNLSATGTEWLITPLVALTRTDRLVFLLTALAFWLLPGLLFGVFRQLGVRSRVAWCWMWVLPAGYCFVLQAGGAGNDLFSVVYCLAALYFTLRARQSQRIEDLWLGTLSAALMTGAKVTNLPLLLPWALAALYSVKLARARPLASIAVALACAGVSFLPMACANYQHTGHWGGDPANTCKVQISNPIHGLVGNTLQLAAANAAPPVVPTAGRWNNAMERLKETPALRALVVGFPRLSLRIAEIPQEEAAAIGLGVSALLALSTGVAFGLSRRAKASRSRTPRRNNPALWVAAGTWVALLAYMSVMGSETGPRLLAPYYPLLVASLLLLGGHTLLVQRRWWRAVAVLAALGSLPPLILSASRPLWPASSVCERLARSHPGNAIVRRAQTVYSTYAVRADGLAPLRNHIPPSATEIGFFGDEGDAETSLWRPFGSRRIRDFTVETCSSLLAHGVSPIVVRAGAVEYLYKRPFEEWRQRHNLRIVARETLTTQVQRGADEWYVLALPSP